MLTKARLKDLAGSIRATLGRWMGAGTGSFASPAQASEQERQKSFVVTLEHGAFDELHVRIAGSVCVDNADRLRTDLTSLIESQPLKNVVLDLAGIEYLDSSGAAILVEVFWLCDRLHNSLKLANVPDRVRRFLDLVDFEQLKIAGILEPLDEPNVVEQIGEGAQRFYSNARDIFIFIGAVTVAMVQDLRRPSTLKWDGFWKLLEKSGADAVPISLILSFLMGAILAFQAAIQLRKFGANIFVADLVSVAICLEMGPLMTSMIVSGRSGAAFAAQIGTMQVTEEVDALRVMGIDPIRYLVCPRILAVALVLPCLTLFADLVGVLGGALVASFSLDITPTAYFNQVKKVLEVSDVLKGLTKSFIFGIEIALIGCLRGFQVRGGAESVGKATTSAVVTSIFVLTITDAIFSALFHYIPSLWAY
jgi:phospholipid/cholesterol/gamma-HCH transport system permease protein